MIISKSIIIKEEEKLLRILREYKTTLVWSIDDIKGINPSNCMHKILIKDNFKLATGHQRRSNPYMKDVVRKEVLKWIDESITYPISNSQWVSLIQMVPKKRGMTIVPNENNELFP